MITSLREKFVPVAIDQHVHRRLRDAEGALFEAVLKQAGRDLGGRSQGVYIFDPAGKLLAFSNTSDAGQVKRLMAKAEADFDRQAAFEVGPNPEAPRQTAPDGTTIVTVTCKVLGGYEQLDGRLVELHAASLGRDHFWIRADEREALEKGSVPASVIQRLVRYHLIDNTRGEPPFWRPEEVKKAELILKDGTLSGAVHLRSSDGQRSYQATLRGHLAMVEGGITRFDLVASGLFEGEGTYTRGAPPGKYPFAVAFRLSESERTADRVIPGAARNNLAGYLK